MRFYEVVFVARQDITPAQVENLAKHYTSVIKQMGGEVSKTEFCGLRTLAYPINKSTKGYYVLFNVKAKYDVIKEIERQLKLSEDILRYLTIRVECLNTNPSPLMQHHNYKEEIIRSQNNDYEVDE